MDTSYTIPVNDRDSFIHFLEPFYQHLLNDPAEWENKTLESFLEAMIRYTEDIQGYYDNTNQAVNSDTASWKVFADIFRGAKMYE